MTEPVAASVAFVGITLLVAYLSLVLGELAPKRIALQRAVGVSLVVAPALDRFATAMRPVIWLLSRSTDVVVRFLGSDPHARREEISEDELRELVSRHKGLGEEERRIVEELFAVGDRQVREVMLPRTEVDFLDAGLPVEEAIRLVSSMPHSRYPVLRGSADDVVGFVHVRDLFDVDTSQHSVLTGDIAREVHVLPDTKRVLPALSELRRQGTHLAIVADEYGGTAGIVTLEDLMEELVGDIRDEYDSTEQAASAGVGGVLDVDGLLNIEDFADEAGVQLPEGPYETAAGFVVARLGRLPEVGDVVETDRARLEVMAVDGRRVARIRVHPAAHPGG